MLGVCRVGRKKKRIARLEKGKNKQIKAAIDTPTVVTLCEDYLKTPKSRGKDRESNS